MTGITGIGGSNVIDTLTGGQRAIMTTGTYARDLVMIHCRGRNRYPGSRELLMTGFTDIAGG